MREVYFGPKVLAHAVGKREKFPEKEKKMRQTQTKRSVGPAVLASM